MVIMSQYMKVDQLLIIIYHILYLGSARLYDIHGVLLLNFDIFEGQNANLKLLECQFWGNGIAAISTEMCLYIVEVRLMYIH